MVSPHEESNLDRRIRSPLLCPLSYGEGMMRLLPKVLLLSIPVLPRRVNDLRERRFEKLLVRGRAIVEVDTGRVQ